MQVMRVPKGEPYFMVAVCICFIGNRSDVLLLQKRKDHPFYPGLWGFPAGKLKTGERTFAEVALREVKEETGNLVPLASLRVLDTHAYQHHMPDGKPFYFIARSFVTDLVLPGFCRNKAEHKAALIVAAEDVFAMNAKNFVPDAHEAFVSHFQRLIKPAEHQQSTELTAPRI